MSNFPAVNARKAIRVFKKFGFEEVRQSSSHVILAKPGHEHHLSIPDHGNRSLKTGLLKGQIKIAGLTNEEFIEKL